MTRSDFEAIWLSRIGEEATTELRRGRKIAGIGMTMPIFAIAAGLLIGTSTRNDVIGVALVLVAGGYFVALIRAQRRIAAALSRWFGVKIKGLPKMNPKRFDDWCQKRGLHRPDERAAKRAGDTSGTSNLA